jgi:hypothetical protein
LFPVRAGGRETPVDPGHTVHAPQDEPFRVEIATGKRQLFKQISPDDPAGIESVDRLRITRDGKAYAYSCLTELSGVYVVEGLR